MTKMLFSLLMIFACVACDPTSRANTTQEPAPKSEYNLTIYGYNYTDTEIGSFEVDGHGGGNLVVSHGNVGGGSSVCCVAINRDFDKTRSFTIQWTRDLNVWCRQEVKLSGLIPLHPEYLQVHFYQDGHIELIASDEISPSRVELQSFSAGRRHERLAENINNDSKFSKCQNERY